MPTIHLIIKGKVQGVFYRATAKEIADELGVSGWIKNTREGYVEVMASGNGESLEQFTDWCKQGPSQAIVTNVTLTQQPDENFSGFRITR